MTHIVCNGHYILILIEWLRYTFMSNIRDGKCLFMLWHVRLGRYESFEYQVISQRLRYDCMIVRNYVIDMSYILNHTSHSESLWVKCHDKFSRNNWTESSWSSPMIKHSFKADLTGLVERDLVHFVTSNWVWQFWFLWLKPFRSDQVRFISS